MTPLIVDASTTPPQPWRNGGGQTRELFTWPAAGDWSLRISRADIAQDGPFSAFPGVRRWFTVLDGAGVVLSFPEEEHTLRPGDAPCEFDGVLAPGCRLLNGPTQDLNLMARRGNAMMQPWQPGQAWSATHRMRGIYTTVAGRWQAGNQRRDLPPHHLLWVLDATGSSEDAPWHFSPQDSTAPHGAWWLGFTPYT